MRVQLPPLPPEFLRGSRQDGLSRSTFNAENRGFESRLPYHGPFVQWIGLRITNPAIGVQIARGLPILGVDGKGAEPPHCHCGHRTGASPADPAKLRPSKIDTVIQLHTHGGGFIRISGRPLRSRRWPEKPDKHVRLVPQIPCRAVAQRQQHCALNAASEGSSPSCPAILSLRF